MIDDLHWHDGNIIKIVISTDEESASTSIDIYAQLIDDTVRTPGRESFHLKCDDVSKFNAVCDLKEIKRNSIHGSIQSLATKNDALRLSLFDGYIEIYAGNFSVKKC